MAISTFNNYRKNHELRAAKRYDNDDELRLLNCTDGVEEFEDAPLAVGQDNMVPSTVNPDTDKKFLWVIRECDVPFILEHATITPALESKVCKHTNLTGGNDAYCGGEVWFVSEDRLILNGGSGRYPPNDAIEFSAVVESYKNAGYEVWSMGWDEGIGGPARVLKGDPPWDM